MLKKLVVLLSCFFILPFSLTGCGQNSAGSDALSKEMKIGAERDIAVNELNDVQMTVIANSLSSRGGKFVLENLSAEGVTFGAEYRLQVLYEGKWHDLKYVSGGANWNALAYVLPSGEAVTYGFDWEYYGVLEPGNYRLVKDVSQSGKTYTIAADFSIEND